MLVKEKPDSRHSTDTAKRPKVPLERSREPTLSRGRRKKQNKIVAFPPQEKTINASSLQERPPVPTRLYVRHDYSEGALIMRVNEETKEWTDQYQRGGKTKRFPPEGNCCANTLIPDDSGVWHGVKCGRRLPSRSRRQLLSSDMRSKVCGPNISGHGTTPPQKGYNQGPKNDATGGRPGFQQMERSACLLKS